ncbi:hypothetical protein GCM10017774_58860 [Lentzea cavernae]|uniref:Uncharacterized protein n=1 Tax=Lentzea cavernae TaxID=2020703 RepID=A0ABQ3MP11_9PSEU|nr:hypothetical protein GCM10017774_58860 [Lentzea cavernae]
MSARPREAALPRSLARIAADGWARDESGACLLSAMRLGPAGPIDDLIGYEARVNGWGIPHHDDVGVLIEWSTRYARECLRRADREVKALFTFSEPHDDVPRTARVTFWAEHPGNLPYSADFLEWDTPAMVLSNEPVTFLYPCDDIQQELMEEMAGVMVAELGLGAAEAVTRVNAFWHDHRRLLHSGLADHQDARYWARTACHTEVGDLEET